MRGLAKLVVFGVVGLLSPQAQADQESTWAALAAGGKVIVMRHADAPGPELDFQGDPVGHRLDDCSTQRNLSELGRRQAAAFGQELRQHGVSVTKIVSSPWCRTMDTARLLGFDVKVEKEPVLRNLTEHEHHTSGGEAAVEDDRLMLKEVRKVIAGWTGPGTLLFVSHGRTIGAIVRSEGAASLSQATAVVLELTPGKGHGFREIGIVPAPVLAPK